MNQGALPLFRLAGISVRIHYTWFLAFFLIAWSLGRGLFPVEYPGWSNTTYLIAGSVAALLVFGSVLVHEFAHSFMALARGLKVDNITLFVFGGAAALKSEPRRPSDEFLIAIVGPASSLLLAVVFLIASSLIPWELPARALVTQLALINAVLAIFNLLPGFPLDGGRVFRAIVWAITGSMRKGTTVATIVGQVFAFGLIALGIFLLFNGGFFSGIWLVFIGWFLNGAASANRRQVTLDETLRKIPASSLMRANPTVVIPDETIDRVVLTMLMGDGVRALPVAQDGQVVGIVTINNARGVPQAAWPVTTVRDVMTPSPLITVRPGEPILDVLQLFDEHAIHQVLVMEGGALRGVLSRSDITRFLELSRELGGKATPLKRERGSGEHDRTGG